MFKICLLIAVVFSLGSCSKERHTNIVHHIMMMESNDLSFAVDNNVLKIDARDPSAYAASHLPDSINLTLKDVMNSPEKVMPVLDGWKNRKMVIYCYGTSCDSSMSVARYLIYGGYRIYVYKSGWESLKELVNAR